jgi:hypothetical protein
MVEHNSVKMKKTFAIFLTVCFLMSASVATVSAWGGSGGHGSGGHGSGGHGQGDHHIDKNSADYQTGYNTGAAVGYTDGQTDFAASPRTYHASYNDNPASISIYNDNYKAGYKTGYRDGYNKGFA